MKQNLYAMFDKLAGTYGVPVPARSEALVARNFVASMLSYVKQEGEKGIKISLDDYRLDCIGSFDDESGLIEACTPRSVALAYPKESS